MTTEPTPDLRTALREAVADVRKSPWFRFEATTDDFVAAIFEWIAAHDALAATTSEPDGAQGEGHNCRHVFDNGEVCNHGHENEPTRFAPVAPDSPDPLREALAALEAADAADSSDRRAELTIALDRSVTQASRRSTIRHLRAAIEGRESQP